MTTLNIELPEDLTSELNERHISQEMIQIFIVQAIHAWLRSEQSGSISEYSKDNGNTSRFAQTALAYVDKLIDENRELFERLAKLPYND